jgi:hypothetical protein
MGMSNLGGIAFGGVFAAVGTYIILIGTKTVAVNPSSVHAPYWVLTLIGVSFALGGCAIWGGTWKQYKTERWRAQAAKRFPNEPALVDYPWHPDGFVVSDWPAAAKTFALALGLSVFLSMFNWWALGPDGVLMVKIITGIFDLITLAFWCSAFRQLAGALKFGHTRVDYTTFPYRPSNPVIIRWQPLGKVSRINKGTFTLRCVEEWMEVTTRGNERTSTLVHEELWSAQWLVEEPHTLQPQEDVELRFVLAPDARPTCLAADKPLFWELEVKLNLPGLNFKEIYLVPVYGN